MNILLGNLRCSSHCKHWPHISMSSVSIMKYGSTPYIGVAPKKNGCPIVCEQSDMLKTLP